MSMRRFYFWGWFGHELAYRTGYACGRTLAEAEKRWLASFSGVSKRGAIIGSEEL